MKTHNLKLINNIEELQKVNAVLEELESAWELPVKVVMNLNLALEEVISNVIFYAFEVGSSHEIDVDFEMKDQKLYVQITDEGVAFNPLQTPPPDDLAKKAEDRKIGGLGIYFVKNFMDGLEYKREHNKNTLTLIKNID